MQKAPVRFRLGAEDRLEKLLAKFKGFEPFSAPCIIVSTVTDLVFSLISDFFWQFLFSFGLFFRCMPFTGDVNNFG
jgi:hypothetical protein